MLNGLLMDCLLLHQSGLLYDHHVVVVGKRYRHRVGHHTIEHAEVVVSVDLVLEQDHREEG